MFEEMYGHAHSHRRVAMALGSMLVTLVFLSVNRETTTMHDALLQEETGSSALRQMRLVNVAPMMEETPGWMVFRSSIDGFNVNQHPSTGPFFFFWSLLSLFDPFPRPSYPKLSFFLPKKNIQVQK